LPSQFSSTSQSLSKDGSALAFLAWFTGAILLTAWLAWFILGKINVVEVSRAAHLEVQQSPSPVVAVKAGKIASTSLALGKDVKLGEVLVMLDSSGDELRLREEESRLTSFAPRITSLSNEIAALGQARGGDQRSAFAATQAAQFRTAEATAALDFAKDSERRLKEESAAGTVAQVDALRASSEAQKIAATRDALAAEGRRLDGDIQSRSHQHQVQLEILRRAVITLEGERKNSEATIARLKNDIDRQVIRSPIAGKIGDMVPLRVGAYLPEGQKLATVVPHGDLIIVGDFQPSSALGRIKPGQISRMRLDGFPWSQFGSIDARVNRVATEIRDQMVRVEFTPIAPFPTKIVMQHGLPGTVSVNLEEASPAQLVLRAVGQMSVAAPQQSGSPAAVKAP
jgi:membrane fusion protein, adhesin transport system